MYVCMYVRMYVCMYICVYVCTYVHMCAACNIRMLCTICASYLCQIISASRNINDWWLSYWITQSNTTTSNSTVSVFAAQHSNSSSDDLRFYLGIYGGLAAANSVSLTCSTTAYYQCVVR